jgi:Magnesium chelatase, subunit ChlI
MLARRLTTVLPAMPLAEALKTTRIHSIAGQTGAHAVFVITRPCGAPGTPWYACALGAGGDPEHCPVQLWHTGGHGSPGDLARPAVTCSGAAGVARMVTDTVHRLARGVASAVPLFRSLRPRREGEGPVERVYVQVGSGTVYAEISGVGPPLILVHGLGGSAR